eukprot:CAMPEP_0116987192 /NCGR_PEP_ID=MMETSP0467-20121206/63358_1 /TAXON_ID=283647 /ORGANISM="Mesodinium pulex, Strain SPMC105" /LENGTH=176 /DNA_ID=CAMNT_0004682961 /DNA_START=97 /DNA_END=627 /DNA_ORIENTATION=+
MYGFYSSNSISIVILAGGHVLGNDVVETLEIGLHFVVVFVVGLEFLEWHLLHGFVEFVVVTQFSQLSLEFGDEFLVVHFAFVEFGHLSLERAETLVLLLDAHDQLGGAVFVVGYFLRLVLLRLVQFGVLELEFLLLLALVDLLVSLFAHLDFADVPLLLQFVVFDAACALALFSLH